MTALRISVAWGERPWWMNLVFCFCLFMTFIYMPFDMLWKPVSEDQEVWFGLTLHGWDAKLTEPLHWFIYGAGAYGFWKMRPWMWPWGAVYSSQVAVSMFVWNVFEGLPAYGLVSFAVFMVPTCLLYRSREHFCLD